MAKKRKARGRREDDLDAEGKAESAPVNRWQSALLAAFVALIVARTFVPEDGGGQQGHGVPFAVLWLALAAAWFLGECRRNAMRVRFGTIDAIVVAFFAWHTLTAAFAIATGNPRSAINVLWDWIAMGLVYLLARQIVWSPREIRSTLVVMIGLAAGMSAVALHQYFVTLPKDIAAYDAAKHSLQALFEQTGQWLPEGSSVRQQFEARLDSRLPTAAFALSNSLAGFLVTWLVVLLGIAFVLRSVPRVAASLGIATAMLVAIVLAGSRTAGLAAVIGVGMLIVDLVATHQLPTKWRHGLVAAFGAAVLAAAAVATTSAGKSALAAAWRSLAFRLEYWHATLAMIGDYPLFGCGPGQFQDTYTTYKLVGAAEEIQDPHNWPLEVAATAGIPAAILLVTALAAIAVRSFLVAQVAATNKDGLFISDNPAAVDAPIFGGVIGVVLGTALAWLIGYPISQTHVILLVAAIVGAWFLWKDWAADGKLPMRLPLIAAATLLVNLLAAGGIGYPSVADSLWLLLAVQMNVVDISGTASTSTSVTSTANHRSATWLRWAIGAALAAAFVVAVRYEYVPVMACRTQLAIADEALAKGQGGIARAALAAARAADPWSPIAVARLADQKFADYEQSSSEDLLRELAAADERTHELAPRRSRFWAQSAGFAEAIFHRTSRVEYRNAAERFLLRAIELYPASAPTHAQAATFWKAVGDATRARREAAEALRLDDAMRDAGHVDRTLRPDVRREIESIASDS